MDRGSIWSPDGGFKILDGAAGQTRVVTKGDMVMVHVVCHSASLEEEACHARTPQLQKQTKRPSSFRHEVATPFCRMVYVRSEGKADSGGRKTEHDLLRNVSPISTEPLCLHGMPRMFSNSLRVVSVPRRARTGTPALARKVRAGECTARRTRPGLASTCAPSAAGHSRWCYLHESAEKSLGHGRA